MERHCYQHREMDRKEIYAMYKSVEGRRLIFQEIGSSKERAQYVYDHMLRYFITKLFSNMGALRLYRKYNKYRNAFVGIYHTADIR